MAVKSQTAVLELTKYNSVDMPEELNVLTEDMEKIDDYAGVVNEWREGVDETLEDFRHEIDLLQPHSITALENKVNANASAIANLTEDVSTLRRRADETDARLDAIEDEQIVQNNRLDGIDVEQAVQNEKIDALRDDLTSLHEHITTYEATTDTRLDNLETAVEQLQIEDEVITTQLSTHATELADHETRISTLEQTGVPAPILDRLETVEGAVTNLTGRVTTLETNVGVLDNTVAGHQQDIDAAESAIQSLQTNMGTAQSDISSLRTRVGAAEVDIMGVQSNVTALGTRVTAVETGLGTANSNISVLQSDVSTAQGNITQLQSDVSTAQGDITQLQSDVSTAQSDITALETQNGNASLTTTAQTLSEAVNELNAGKQDKLTFDSVPTANSTNPVTSGGVYANAIKFAKFSDSKQLTASSSSVQFDIPTGSLAVNEVVGLIISRFFGQTTGTWIGRVSYISDMNTLKNSINNDHDFKLQVCVDTTQIYLVEVTILYT